MDDKKKKRGRRSMYEKKKEDRTSSLADVRSLLSYNHEGETKKQERVLIRVNERPTYYSSRGGERGRRSLPGDN